MADLLFCPIRPDEGILGVCSSSLMWLVDEKKAYEGSLGGKWGTPWECGVVFAATDVELLGEWLTEWR